MVFISINYPFNERGAKWTSRNNSKHFVKVLDWTAAGLPHLPQEWAALSYACFPIISQLKRRAISPAMQSCRITTWWSANYLLRISAFLQEQTGNDYSGQIYCDNSPYHDRLLAYHAGLGVIGRNTCLIHPVYGSYVFIGYIVCESLDLAPDKPLSGGCIGCGKCRTACHGNALQAEEIQIERCASHITQKKGDLSETEQSILLNNPLIWGCDTCQEVCPHNHSIPVTPILEFRQSLLPFLTQEDLLPLSGREFRARYRQRAFSWR